MDAGHWLTLLLGAVIGASIVYFQGWHIARKIEALVPGGLAAWDAYDAKADHASPTGRTVTTDGA